MFSRVFSFAQNVVFPKFCFSCKRIGSYVCSQCAKKLIRATTNICPYCEGVSQHGITHVRCRRKYGVDGLVSFYLYDSTLQYILKSIKYRNIRSGLCELVGHITNHLWKVKLASINSQLQNGAVLVPIPLHRLKQANRGFNQAEDLARAFSIHLERSVSTSILYRIKHTDPQAQTKNRKERERNIQKAFSVPQRLAQKNHLPESIIIVDDVWTTGFTIKEATKMLKKQGVQHIFALTLARRE